MYVQLTYKYKNGSELFELTDQMTSRSSQNVTLIHVFLRFLVWKCKEKMQVRETLTRRIITGRAAKSNQSAPKLYQQMTRLHYTENCAQAQGAEMKTNPTCARETIGFYSWQKRKISEEQNAASLNLFPQEQPLCFSIYSIHLLLYNSHLHANPAISLRLLFTLVNSLGSHSNALDFDFAVSAAATIDVKGFCMAGIIYTTVFMREMYLRTVSTF